MPHRHDAADPPRAVPAGVARAAELFAALGDPGRLALALLIDDREVCVGELVAATGERLPLISQRLLWLYRRGLLSRRRAGKHIFYRLADRHMLDLVRTAIDHVDAETAKPAEAGGARR